ncbi:unnamed protein product [Protopolystoma xenopodis]|uniref:Uncharacterized protein n=1 Tax=Protopolystoma xenopodis TaxID=117903 RepID=A0A448WG34_9PLAT|nr:unnamed protein product [Protopolystoma xenopodis]
MEGSHSRSTGYLELEERSDPGAKTHPLFPLPSPPPPSHTLSSMPSSLTPIEPFTSSASAELELSSLPFPFSTSLFQAPPILKQTPQWHGSKKTHHPTQSCRLGTSREGQLECLPDSPARQVGTSLLASPRPTSAETLPSNGCLVGHHVTITDAVGAQ